MLTQVLVAAEVWDGGGGGALICGPYMPVSHSLAFWGQCEHTAQLPAPPIMNGLIVRHIASLLD